MIKFAKLNKFILITHSNTDLINNTNHWSNSFLHNFFNRLFSFLEGPKPLDAPDNNETNCYE